MTLNQIEQIKIAVAKMDGWKEFKTNDIHGNHLVWKHDNYPFGVYEEQLPNYPTSHDAILPVIVKIFCNDADSRKQFVVALNCTLFPMGGDYKDLDLNEVCWLQIVATPLQLCIACLKAEKAL